jgi:hypothetical protein
MSEIAMGYEWPHITHAFRRTAERRNNMVYWSLSPTEKSAKLAPFRLIIPLCEKLTAYLAKKPPFARVGPIRANIVCFDLDYGQPIPSA